MLASAHDATILDFTELYRVSSFLAIPSPDNTMIATAVDHRLVVRDAESLQIVQLFACAASIDVVAWAHDSNLILVASKLKKSIQVWSIIDPDWKCSVDEGIAGLANVIWAPDGRHLLSFSDFQLRITVWSLITKEASYIQYPKFSNRGYCFRKDGRYFALSERKDGKDTLSIYDCEDWTLLKHFPVDTSDLEDISWSPDGSFIAVWDSILEYKLLIYSPDGRLVTSYSAYETGLGIKTVCWSPSSQFVAIGSFDEKTRLINNMTWKPLIDFSHPSNLPYPDIKVYKESNQRDIKDISKLKVWSVTVKHYIVSFSLTDELIKPPITVPSIRAEIEKVITPKRGVGICEFNCDGRYLATRNDNMPNALWIWDLINLQQVALVQQITSIKQICWNPVVPGLCAISCSNSYVYLWSSGNSGFNDGGNDVGFGGDDDDDDAGIGGCSAIEVPAVNFQIAQIRWTPDGRSMVLMDKDKFCLAFLVEG
ncbi:WD repeat-containing protein wrap73 [Physocladia obscura]|uniref:WD repeat-containing protein wrap73 n=1 Tax=Physocladia obscura TaxID=109957 RepID=A0AAD5XII9_9FUNG|nr:WD repeat-containing protein wrap73 [Physocladia obscura]